MLHKIKEEKIEKIPHILGCREWARDREKKMQTVKVLQAKKNKKKCSGKRNKERKKGKTVCMYNGMDCKCCWKNKWL